jgi:hypothetical protein
VGCPGGEEGIKIIIDVGLKKKWLGGYGLKIKLFTILGETRKFCKKKGREEIWSGPTTRMTT